MKNESTATKVKKETAAAKVKLQSAVRKVKKKPAAIKPVKKEPTLDKLKKPTAVKKVPAAKSVSKTAQVRGFKTKDVDKLVEELLDDSPSKPKKLTAAQQKLKTQLESYLEVIDAGKEECSSEAECSC